MGPHRYDLDPNRATQKEREVVALILDGKMREARGQAMCMCAALLLFTPVAILGMIGGVLMAIMMFCMEVQGNGGKPTFGISDVFQVVLCMTWSVFLLDQLVKMKLGIANRLVFLWATLGIVLLMYCADGVTSPAFPLWLKIVPLAMVTFGLMGYQYTGVVDLHCQESDAAGVVAKFHLATFTAALLFWGYSEAIKQAWLCLGLRREDRLYAADVLYAAANQNRRVLQSLLERVGEERMKRIIITLEKLSLLHLGKKDLILTNNGEVALGLRPHMPS